MEGGEEAAGNRWTQGARHGGRRGGSGKPLDAGSVAWREESRQRGNRWTQGEQHGGGREEAAGKPLNAVGARGAQEQ